MPYQGKGQGWRRCNDEDVVGAGFEDRLGWSLHKAVSRELPRRAACDSPHKRPVPPHSAEGDPDNLLDLGVAGISSGFSLLLAAISSHTMSLRGSREQLTILCSFPQHCNFRIVSGWL